MSQLLKLATMLMIGVAPLISLANYRVTIPLEIAQGGGLPNGSINLGDGTNQDNGTPPPASTNCLYGPYENVVVYTTSDAVYWTGDELYNYNHKRIGYHMPARGVSLPSGLSKGAEKARDADTITYEICADDFESYPPLPPVGFLPPIGGGTPPPDIEDPDYTPECLPVDTTNNYAAYNLVTGKYEYNSTTYGIDHVNVNWVYKPADYDEDRPGSYQYLPDNNDSVTGPNPNYEYNGICRVKKRLE